MKATLWGPALWQAMFACTWSCPADEMDQLRTLLMELLPLLLPCQKCRRHYRLHAPKLLQRYGTPRTPDRMFTWLYHLKDQINHSLGQRSIREIELRERMRYQGPLVDDIAFADCLVLIAIHAHALQRDDVFLAACAAFSHFLPLAQDSQFAQLLARPSRPIAQYAYTLTRAARTERGLPCFRLKHYRELSDPSAAEE